MNQEVLIVGAGFSGAILARHIAENSSLRCLVIDERPHIAGNCHTTRDPETGIMVHQYGPHIFHTSNLEVWNYVNRFAEMVPFINRVKTSIPQGIFSMPINLHTINQFFGLRLSPEQAKSFIHSKGDFSISEPRNFEEQALRMIGVELYDAFFRGYTIKQWGCDPKELPASILKRLPIRFNYDDNYYSSIYQGIPRGGYTDLIARILDHPNIRVGLSEKYDHNSHKNYLHTFYTGPIDEYHHNCFGRLGYRTVYWDKTQQAGDILGNAVINYPSLSDPYTRIHEHKHFTPWESHDQSIAFTEFSKETEEDDIPYYPKRLTRDKEILKMYIELSTTNPSASFLGRLATYRYMDMHHVIAEALTFSECWLNAWSQKNPLPTFSVNPESIY